MKIVKVSSAGDLMHVVVYSRGSRWDSETARKIKKKYKDKAYQAINHHNSIQKMEEMVACNFNAHDYHVVFTLAEAWNTTDYKRLRQYWQGFMARVRMMRKRRGAVPLRYIYVMEGLHGDKRLHIHCLLSAAELDGEGWAEIRKSWIYGDVSETVIENWEHRNHVGRYLSKEPRKLGRIRVGQRIFNASHNCEKPIKISYSIPDDTAFEVPDGYTVRANNPMKSEFGVFEFYVLTKEGSTMDVSEWL